MQMFERAGGGGENYDDSRNVHAYKAPVLDDPDGCLVVFDKWLKQSGH